MGIHISLQEEMIPEKHNKCNKRTMLPSETSAKPPEMIGKGGAGDLP
jgi:hypothetical protein